MWNSLGLRLKLIVTKSVTGRLIFYRGRTTFFRGRPLFFRG